EAGRVVAIARGPRDTSVIASRAPGRATVEAFSAAEELALRPAFRSSSAIPPRGRSLPPDRTPPRRDGRPAAPLPDPINRRLRNVPSPTFAPPAPPRGA